MSYRSQFNWNEVSIKVGATADPAAGANPAAVTVPAGKKWLLLGTFSTEVNDANAANRYPYLEVVYSGGPTLRFSQGTAFTASLTGYIASVPGGVAGLLNIAGVMYITLPFPTMGLELTAGSTFQQKTGNIQATDDITALTYAYKEAPA